MLRICSKCKEEKSKTAFSPARKKKSGFQSHCKVCRAEYNKRHYRQNKAKYIENKNHNKETILNELRQYKEKNPCADCGKYFPYYAMEFDHQHSKKYEIAIIARHGSRKKLWEEIKKCELVCCLCHRHRTHGENRSVV